MKTNTTLILGGDRRSLYLGEYLEKLGVSVCYYAFSDTNCFSSLGEALAQSQFVILPLPFTRDRVTLNTPLFNEKIPITELSALIKSDTVVFGGQLPVCFTEELALRGVRFYDYFEFEELAVYNALPTAEGVAGILINELPLTVHSMKCAVTGYGRTGKMICRTLGALGADVTVFARRQSDFADAFSRGFNPLPYSTLREKEHDFDVLINTVPAKIITRAELKNLKPDCTLIETASAPFGIDFQAAKELALNVIKANSLPGRVAPKTAGEIIGRSVLPIMKSEGLTL